MKPQQVITNTGSDAIFSERETDLVLRGQQKRSKTTKASESNNSNKE